MRHWIATALVVAAFGLTGLGCAKDKPMSGSSSAMDACTHCPGVQKATADGKCPECGMKVSMMDACPTCPGVQTANADGTCPACGKKTM